MPFPWFHRLFGSAYEFLNTGLRQTNEYAFHAMAVDEHRKAFAPTLWSNQGATSAKPRPIERTEQRWFISAHANVGGGCFNDPLAQLPFNWLAHKAESLGLAFSDGFATEPNAANAPISIPMPNLYGGCIASLLFSVRITVDRRTAQGRRRRRHQHQRNHPRLVFERWRADQTYRPPRSRPGPSRGASTGAIISAVRTDDPKVVVGLDATPSSWPAWSRPSTLFLARMLLRR